MSTPQTEVILRHHDAELARVTLPPGEYIIGRDPSAQIYADTPLLSRKHALLTINHDTIVLEDLGSSNGTFIGGRPVAGASQVLAGQPARLGDVALVVNRADGEGGNSAPGPANIHGVLPAELFADQRYAVGSVVARGGMGAILDAHQTAIDRTVAMKVMLETGDKADVLRFIDEAKITGQLDHPNIVPIYELGVDPQGQPFYTMKFVRGITLKKVLELQAEGVEATLKKYPLCALLTVFQKACDAIAFAHSKGVIHRDLKPENIMLGDFGSVLVMDWGLAKVIGGAETLRTVKRHSGNVGSTMQGSVMGTPQYMAPEQARGEVETMDQRADIYALGAILYHMLALRPSVSGDDPWAIVAKVARGQIEPLGSSSSSVSRSAGSGKEKEKQRDGSRAIPDSLAAVVRKAMAFDPAQRYARVEEIQGDIEAYQNGFATSAEKAGAWKQFTLFVRRHKAASIGAAAVLVVGTTLGTQTILEGRRAERMLGELRGTAPTFADQARALIVDADFAGALQKIDYAVQLAPGEAEHHVLRGHILQSLLRFNEAEAAYRAALQRDSSHRVAAENAPLSRKLATQLADGVLSRAGYDELRRIMTAQGRTTEASLISSHLGGAAKENLEKWTPIIAKAFRGYNVTLRPDEGGLLLLYLGNGKDQAAVVTDISALKGMPLRTLGLTNTKQLTDITPLAGAPIENLNLQHSGVTDGTAMKGMPLRTLNWNYVPEVYDLSPLAGAPLQELFINQTRVTTLAPIKGARLRELDIARTNIVDLSPLTGMPLERLIMRGTAITDLRPLAGSPLKYLHLGTTPVSDLRPLAGTKLEFLSADWQNTSITDISALRGLPLRELIIPATSVTDISALADCATLEYIVLPEAQKAKLDLAPLRRLPKLQRIAFSDRDIGRDKAPLAADFWKAYDAEPKPSP